MHSHRLYMIVIFIHLTKRVKTINGINWHGCYIRVTLPYVSLKSICLKMMSKHKNLQTPIHGLNKDRFQLLKRCCNSYCFNLMEATNIIYFFWQWFCSFVLFQCKLLQKYLMKKCLLFFNFRNLILESLRMSNI